MDDGASNGGLYVPARPFYVQALYPYSSNEASSLSFERGDVIEVLSTLASGWWDGVLVHKRVRGWFPSNFVNRLDDDDVDAAIQDGLTADTFTGGIITGTTSLTDGAVATMTADETLARLMNGNDLGATASTATDAHAYAGAGADQRAMRRPSDDTSRQTDLEDLWLPRMTKSGQLFYLNSRTKETSRDLPVDGVGDGSVISPSEFASDSEDEQGSEANWTQHYTQDGAAVYYVNSETGEKSWTRPPALSRRVDRLSQLDVPQSLYSRQSMGQASLMSAWTEKTAIPSHSASTSAPSPRRDSETSEGDESAPDSAIEGSSLPLRPRRPSSSIPPRPSPSKEERRRSRMQARRALTKELIEVAPPPLLDDLETLVSRALQGLVLAIQEQMSSAADVANGDKPRLAAAIEAAAAAMRATLHATSVLDYPISQASTSSALPYFVPLSVSKNVIDGSFGPSMALPIQILTQLRPYHRRLVSTFSKVLFSARALWGILDTIDQDQPVTAEDILIYSDEEVTTMRNNWAISRTARLDQANKLRLETASGAEEVRSHFAAFVAQFEALVADVPPTRSLLRAPRSLQGSLRTSAAALLLPGGGYGGNWRGNGFVTLPDSSPTSSDEAFLHSTGSLSYSYPSRRLNKATVSNVAEESSFIIEEVEALRIAADARIDTTMTTRIAGLQSRLSSLLETLEDIDIASSVDTEIRGKPDDDFSTPAESSSNLLATSDDLGASGDLVKFKATVMEAKSLLGTFQARKQTLYDSSALLVCAVQNAFVLATLRRSSASPLGPQPFDAMSRIAPRDSTEVTLSSCLPALATALTDLRIALEGLYDISTKQDAAPKDIRRSLVIRHSLNPSPSTSSLSRFEGEDSIAPSSASHSNRHSVVFGAGGEQANGSITTDASRQSVDSDFFFSNSNGSAIGAKTSASTPLSTVASKIRAPSVMTTSSLASEALSTRADSMDSGSASRSPSKTKLVQLLGPDAAINRSRSADSLPWYLGHDYGPEDISFNMEGQVKGGTLRGLVIAATSHEGRVDSNYLSTFLLTYRTFCTSQQLLDQLIERYSISPPPELSNDDLKNWETRKLKPIKARVANMIKAWVREYLDTDERNVAILRDIARFALDVMQDPVQSPQIIKAVDERLAGNAPRPIGSLAPGPLPQSLVPRTFRKLRLTDIDPLEVARQLTIMEGRLFARITPQECLAKAWPKEFSSETPNISAMIDMSNAVTRWVTESILALEDVKKRASMIKAFVQIGERCLSLNNFSTLIHIIAGLNSTPIHRLRRTWEVVSQKTMYALGALNKVMKPDKNYKEYRETLRRVTPPCVPFLGVYLTDWTFIGDGNPDVLREKPHQINFNKRQKAAELILAIKLHQATTYNLAAVPALVKFLEEQLFSPDKAAVTDQRLYELSLQREPRERDDEKIARLLSESGFL